MPKILIAGCGFLGLASARLFLEGGWDVVGCTGSPESAARLAGEAFPVFATDIAVRDSLELHRGVGPFDAVFHCASSGRGGPEDYRRVYVDGARNLAAVFAPPLFLFASSTSVYAQEDGGWVNEESPATPGRETGRLLRAAEDFVLSQNGTAARLAGIYGPGRSVLLRKFFDGSARIEGDGSRWINQAHRDDIATAIFQLVSGNRRGLFNVCDDSPQMQRDLYAWLANRFARPLPPSGPIDPNRKRGWTNKRVSNARLKGLGWVPRFPSFQQAVDGDPQIIARADESGDAPP